MRLEYCQRGHQEWATARNGDRFCRACDRNRERTRRNQVPLGEYLEQQRLIRTSGVCRYGHTNIGYRTKGRKVGQRFCRECENTRNRHLRMEVLLAYGATCSCLGCGEWRSEFLEIDHINGGGNRHFQEIGAGMVFYRLLKRSGYPEEYRVLCSNCNKSRGRYGYCPHEEQG